MANALMRQLPLTKNKLIFLYRSSSVFLSGLLAIILRLTNFVLILCSIVMLQGCYSWDAIMQRLRALQLEDMVEVVHNNFSVIFDMALDHILCSLI